MVSALFLERAVRLGDQVCQPFGGGENLFNLCRDEVAGLVFGAQCQAPQGLSKVNQSYLLMFQVVIDHLSGFGQFLRPNRIIPVFLGQSQP
jgi:hypothetical protein